MKIIRQHTLLMAVVILSSSCATYDPYTGNKQTSKATAGAAIGAGVAALGAAIANRDEDDARTRNERILKSAAAGGVIGGGIGYYMDRQEAKLRAQLANTGVGVQRDGDNLTLVMPGNITFSSNSFDIRSDFLDIFNSVGLVLTEFDKTLIEISGHTDNTGADSYNIQLSQQRAQSVANQLRKQGISGDRVITQGYGEARPIADNSTASGRSANRRVELRLVPIQG